jgi:large subunit ribosomal protein L17
MRHRVAGKGFHRNTKQRKALLRTLTVSLFKHLRIETTVIKAKELRKIAEPLITFAKKGDLNSRRVVLSRIPHKSTVTRLFTQIAPVLTDRHGGYLRIVKTRFRQGDGASMAIIEFVDYDAISEYQPETKNNQSDKTDKNE